MILTQLREVELRQCDRSLRDGSRIPVITKLVLLVVDGVETSHQATTRERILAQLGERLVGRCKLCHQLVSSMDRLCELVLPAFNQSINQSINQM